jgi:hypothetical protein
VRYVDAIRGELELDANRNDAVILKSSDQSPSCRRTTSRTPSTTT